MASPGSNARACVVSLLAIGWAIGCAGAAAAQNLIVDGTFDTPDSLAVLGSWDNISGAKVWSSLDVDDDPNSGSVAITNAGGGQTSVFISQCIPVVGGEIYTYGASHLSSGENATGRADVGILYYDAADCPQSGPLTFATTSGLATEVWSDLQGSLEAPANALSASLSLIAFKTGGTASDPWVVNFDDASVTLPEPGTASAGAAVLAALALQRRRVRASAVSTSPPTSSSAAARGSGAGRG